MVYLQDQLQIIKVAVGIRTCIHSSDWINIRYLYNINDTHTANNDFGKHQLSVAGNKNEIFLKDVKVCGGTVF